MNARRKLPSLWLVLILLGTGGCAGGSGTPASTSAPPGSGYGAGPTAGTAAATITIKDFAYGDPLTVAPGAAVTVTNMDSPAHTVTADEGAAFDAEVKGGGTATFTAPTKPGSYPYHCTPHPNMHGTLIVK